MEVNHKRLALVTGGTRGIGKAVSVELKKAGYQVAANYARDDDRAAKFTEETGIPAYKWDASSLKSCMEYVEKVEQDFNSGVDVLVNNAGIKRDAMFHKMAEEDWAAVLEQNVRSCFSMCLATYPKMRSRGFGRIVNISSVNGLKGQVGQTNYSASKAAIIGFSKSLALEAASKGVTINVVAPGYIATDMVSSISQKVLDQIVASVPVQRLGLPEEVARGVLFLVADDAGFIVGTTLSINGGFYM